MRHRATQGPPSELHRAPPSLKASVATAPPANGLLVRAASTSKIMTTVPPKAVALPMSKCTFFFESPCYRAAPRHTEAATLPRRTSLVKKLSAEDALLRPHLLHRMASPTAGWSQDLLPVRGLVAPLTRPRSAPTLQKPPRWSPNNPPSSRSLRLLEASAQPSSTASPPPSSTPSSSASPSSPTIPSFEEILADSPTAVMQAQRSPPPSSVSPSSTATPIFEQVMAGSPAAAMPASRSPPPRPPSSARRRIHYAPATTPTSSAPHWVEVRASHKSPGARGSQMRFARRRATEASSPETSGLR